MKFKTTLAPTLRKFIKKLEEKNIDCYVGQNRIRNQAGSIFTVRIESKIEVAKKLAIEVGMEF